MSVKNNSKKQIYLTENSTVNSILEKTHKIAGTSVPVFITGETGSGKTELARYIHSKSNRKNAPFLHINCAAIPETLLEAELFGFTKGSFTGAYKDTQGKFYAAGDGTILLDEIGEIPPYLQAKLLKVVDEKEYYPLGSAIVQKMKARIIAATNTDIVQAVKTKKFRQDLYFRLNTFEIHIPPLRERKEDITLFFNFFLNLYYDKKKKSVPVINSQVYDALMEYSWPGNIREVQNVVETLAIGGKSEIGLEDLPRYIFGSVQGELILAASEHKSLEEVKKDYIKYIYKITENNKKQTARILKVDVKTVRKVLI